MTKQDLRLALSRCKFEFPFDIRYVESSDTFVVDLEELVVMSYQLERVLLVGGFLSIFSNSKGSVFLCFDAAACV